MSTEPQGDLNTVAYEHRAPEVYLGAGWSSSADIWNLGVFVSMVCVYLQKSPLTSRCSSSPISRARIYGPLLVITPIR